MNELINLENVKIDEMIYEIRNKLVILDSDVAKLYRVETKRINEAMKNNIMRFPEHFCFKLNAEEYEKILRSKISTKESGKGKHRKYLPYVYTEQGIAMLSGIIKNNVAINVSIRIIDAFVLMRKYIASNNYNLRISNIESKLIEHDVKFNEIFEKLENKPNNHIFFEGQIYDAYSLMIDILNTAKNSIIVIDNYIDKNLLDILSKLNKTVLIITNKINGNDLEKYKLQYNNLKIVINNYFHDRFIILDKKILYHCGASFKDLGKKCFAITKIDDFNILHNLLEKIK